MTTIISIFLALFLAQDSVPRLSELQKTQLEMAMVKLDLAHIKHLQAEKDLTTATDTLQGLLKTLYRAGFELDVSTMQYKEKK